MCKDPEKVRVQTWSTQTGEQRSREGGWGEQGKGHCAANLRFAPAVETGPGTPWCSLSSAAAGQPCPLQSFDLTSVSQEPDGRGQVT